MATTISIVTYADARVLAKVVEEMGEAQQAIGKTLIHGWESESGGVVRHNRDRLEEELGDVIATIEVLAERGIVDLAAIELRAAQKKAKLLGSSL